MSPNAERKELDYATTRETVEYGSCGQSQSTPHSFTMTAVSRCVIASRTTSMTSAPNIDPFYDSYSNPLTLNNVAKDARVSQGEAQSAGLDDEKERCE